MTAFVGIIIKTFVAGWINPETLSSSSSQGQNCPIRTFQYAGFPRLSLLSSLFRRILS
jgi:hypothetical protein